MNQIAIIVDPNFGIDDDYNEILRLIAHAHGARHFSELTFVARDGGRTVTRESDPVLHTRLAAARYRGEAIAYTCEADGADDYEYEWSNVLNEEWAVALRETMNATAAA